jgi:hypothetical protein
MGIKTKHLLFIILLSSVSCFKSFSQDNNVLNRIFIDGFYHYGFDVPHHDFMTYFVNEHVQGYQFNIGLHTIGNKKWQQQYNYPDVGIGFYHSGLGNKEIFGHVSAIYGFYTHYFFNKDSRFNLGNRLSLGLSFIDKKFDVDTNPFNMEMSTTVNVYINYSFEGNIRLTPNLKLKLGLGLSHISNGNTKEPNKGINFFTSFAGLSYSFLSPQKTEIKHIQFIPDTINNQFNISGTCGFKSISRFNNNTYPVYAIAFEYERKITDKSWLGLAWVNYCDKSLKQELYNQDNTYSYKPIDLYRSTIHLAYEIKMGQLSYLFQPGVYLVNKYKHYGSISNRFGLRYYFNSNVTASVIVKAHWVAIADLIEWGIGFKF